MYVPLACIHKSSMDLPAFSLGTYRVRGDACVVYVKGALAYGCRSIDTATCYKNETEVGMAIRASGIARESLFVTTKISPQEAALGPDGVNTACREALQRLSLTYVDCLMLHWPAVAGAPPSDSSHIKKRSEVWSAMESCRKQGMCRYLGVSNFLPRHLDSLPSKPDIHQFERHLLCRQDAVVEYCTRHGIIVQQYSPLGSGNVQLMQHPGLLDVAASEGTSVSRLALGWCALTGGRVVVRASPLHIAESMDSVMRVVRNEVDESERSALARLDSLRAPKDHHICWFSEQVP